MKKTKYLIILAVIGLFIFAVYEVKAQGSLFNRIQISDRTATYIDNKPSDYIDTLVEKDYKASLNQQFNNLIRNCRRNTDTLQDCIMKLETS